MTYIINSSFKIFCGFEVNGQQVDSALHQTNKFLATIPSSVYKNIEQAHHQEVEELLGLVWDFIKSEHEFNYPKVTGVFYANNLTTDDWGRISGTEGRNTKVTGMKVSGKEKMGQGWIAIIDHPLYKEIYQKILKFSILGKS